MLFQFPITQSSDCLSRYQVLWKELSLRGHQVTVLTPNPLNDKLLINLTEINLSSTYKFVENNNLQQSLSKSSSQPELYKSLYKLILLIFENDMQHPKVQKLINDQRKSFDLVLIEALHPASFSFAAHYQAPVIGLTSLNAFGNTYYAVGNPSHPILNPNLFSLNIYENMNLWHRIESVFVTVWYKLWYDYTVLPETDEIIKKYFGENTPYIGDVEKNISMVLINTNPVIHPIKANVPALVELGQMHLQPRKALPEDLQNILDSSKEGVIYLSLGTNVKSVHLLPDIRNKIIDAVSSIPYKVLWKWESDEFPNQPKNVVFRKWLPQQDLLAHPNIKAFVTQGGLQSLEEAIINSVPVVGIPFFADQPMNIQKLVKLGAGIYIDSSDFTVNQLKSAILEIVSNKKYKSKMNELKMILQDQPMTSLQKAVWWTEYVIRHKGAKYLRSSSVDIPLYKYFLLDVIGLVSTVIIVALFIVNKVLRGVIKLLSICKNKRKFD